MQWTWKFCQLEQRVFHVTLSQTILTKYQEIICNTQDSIPDFNLSSSSVHATPSKKPWSDNDTTDIDKDICSICYIRYMTTEDVATDLAWISCNRPCNWWVHTRCIGIHYENTKKGEKKLDDWQSIIITAKNISQKPRQLDGTKFNKKKLLKNSQIKEKHWKKLSQKKRNSVKNNKK